MIHQFHPLQFGITLMHNWNFDESIINRQKNTKTFTTLYILAGLNHITL